MPPYKETFDHPELLSDYTHTEEEVTESIKRRATEREVTELPSAEPRLADLLRFLMIDPTEEAVMHWIAADIRKYFRLTGKITQQELEIAYPDDNWLQRPDLPLHGFTPPPSLDQVAR